MFQLIDVATGNPVDDKVYSDAHTAIAAMPNYPFAKLRVKRMVDNSWKAREQARFDDGTYERLPVYILEHCPVDHFAHVSSLDETKIAFTESPEKGMADIQTVVSASTYLSRVAGDKLASHTIRDLAARYTARKTEETLTISHDRKAFRFAYDDQPVKSESSDYVSCMARSARSYTRNYNLHPAEAYATDGNGLAIAYTISPTHAYTVTARAVVWPKHQTYVRVYGLTEDYRQSLKALLEARGFTRSEDFDGAPLAAIGVDCDDDDSEGEFLMPYIDGEVKHVEHAPHKRRFFICEDGDIRANDTSGTVSLGSYTTCQYCDERIRDDDSQYIVNGYETWCESCYENEAFTCEYSGDVYSNSRTAYTVNRRQPRYDRPGTYRQWEETWCYDAISDAAFHCVHTGEYYHNGEFDEIEVIVSKSGVTEMWCQQATEDDHFYCPDCDNYYHIDFKHPDSDLCIHCHEANVAHDEARGYPQPTHVKDERQLVLSNI